MGSGSWFKNIINKRKLKGGRSKKLKSLSAERNDFKVEIPVGKGHTLLGNGSSVHSQGGSGLTDDEAAAIRIQAACRAYLARKKLHHLRGMARLHNLVRRASVQKQPSATMTHLHSWSKIQAEIRARRVQMVTVGHLKLKNAENQLKLEAKLHDLEVEWSGGSETIDEALARIHLREEAAARRERAMAYAFSHQWRASSSPTFGSVYQELGNPNWGWSWMDNWIAARPWEGWSAAKSSKPIKNTKKANSSMTVKSKVIPHSKKCSVSKAKKPGQIKDDSTLDSVDGEVKPNDEKDGSS